MDATHFFHCGGGRPRIHSRQRACRHAGLPGPDRPPDRQVQGRRAGQQVGVRLNVLRAIGTGAHVFQLSRTVSLAEAKAVAADLMARDASIDYAEPDRILTGQSTPNDPRYAEQWDFYEAAGGLRLPTAWDIATGSGINVAVIDTGYRPHADLAGQVLPGYDFIASSALAGDGDGRDKDAQDPGDWLTASQCSAGVPAQDQSSSWHGTHVAGKIAARTNNGVGVAGVAYNARTARRWRTATRPTAAPRWRRRTWRVWPR